MPIRILLFAAARDAAGMSEVTIARPPGTVAELRQAISAAAPGIGPVLARSRLAVNEEIAAEDAPVPDGADVAVIPPVAGG